ncbi:TIR domain-containing protein [Nocardia sp. NPDC024068]|uniref:nSTAND1 domain-containing NTPase n=1 Tax=Nocardia sp. NPDC024068 TaxID=3157197 RepID=UPI0033D29D0F
MTRIFISHSSRDNPSAIAVKQWLIDQDPGLAEEIFLDLDPRTGIATGQKWADVLREAGTRCEAVVCLVSPAWIASRPCLEEYLTAKILGKRIFIARLGPIADGDFTREWQRCDLFGDGPTTDIVVPTLAEPVQISTAGLDRLLHGLRAAGIAAALFPWPPPDEPDRAPYRGWDPLEPMDAAIYFGRDAQITHGIDRLRTMRFGTRGLFVILGASGTGKSSFLRAGLIPRLQREDREFVVLEMMRPERHALTGDYGLASSVQATLERFELPHPSLGQMKSRLKDGDSSVLREWLTRIRSTAARQRRDDAGDPTLVLPVDQAEELFSADAGEEGSTALELFAAMVSPSAPDRVPLIIVATIRTDRYAAMQSAPQLANVESELFDELKPMPADRFREIILEPAHRHNHNGRRLEFDREVIDQILDDLRDGADTLPLLALTLSALFRDYGKTSRITVENYAELGGIKGVVDAEIDQILEGSRPAREEQLALLHSAFIPWLATVSPDSDQPLRRIARYADLPAAALPLIDKFVDRRLLSKDRSGEDITVEVTLESLLRQWADLASWLRKHADDLRTADTIALGAAAWDRHQRGNAWLLTGSRLTDAETLAQQPAYRDLLSRFHDYLVSSRRAESERTESDLAVARKHASDLRKRGRALIAITTAAVLAAILAGTGFFLQARASERADMRSREILVTKLTSEADQLFAGTIPGGYLRSLHQVLAAHSLSPDRTERHLLNAQYRLRGVTHLGNLPIQPTSAEIGFIEDEPTASACANDGSSVLGIGPGSRLPGLGSAAEYCTASANGNALLYTLDSTRLLVAKSGEPERIIGLENPIIGIPSISADGTSVVAITEHSRRGTTGYNNEIIIDRHGVSEAPIEASGTISNVYISADGNTVAAVSQGSDGGHKMMISSPGTSIPEIPLPAAPQLMNISENGRVIAIADYDGNLNIFRDGARAESIPLPGGVPTALAINKSGTTVAAKTGTLISNGPLTVTRIGHAPKYSAGQYSITDMRISDDGSAIVAATGGNEIVIMRENTPDRRIELNDVVTRIAIGADGTVAAAGSAGGEVAVVWEPGLAEQRTLLGGQITSLSLNTAGTAVAAIDINGEYVVRHDDSPTRFPTGAQIGAFATSSDGSTAVAANGRTDAHSDLHISRTGHPVKTLRIAGNITDLAVSADGETIAVNTDNNDRTAGEILVFQSDTIIRRIPAREVGGIEISEDGTTVAAMTYQSDGVGDIIISRTGSAAVIEIPIAEEIQALTVSDNGEVVAASTNRPDDTSRIIVSRKGLPEQQLQLGEFATALAMNSDGTTVAAGGSRGGLLIHRTDGTEDLLELGGFVSAIAMDSDGDNLAIATSGEDNRGEVSIINGGSPERRIQITGSGTSVAMSDDGETVVAGSLDGSVAISEKAAGEILLRVPRGVLRLVLGPDGSQFFLADADGTLWQWRRGDGALTMLGDRSDIGLVAVFDLGADFTNRTIPVTRIDSIEHHTYSSPDRNALCRILDSRITDAQWKLLVSEDVPPHPEC